LIFLLYGDELGLFGPNKYILVVQGQQEHILAALVRNPMDAIPTYYAQPYSSKINIIKE
jgi:hypothetical protein